MDKKQIIEKIIPKLEKRLAHLQESIEKAEQSAIKSPGAMQSWSDTSRFQHMAMAANLKPRYKRLQESVQALKKIDASETCQKVKIGAVVKIKTGGKTAFYFIVPPDAGGETLEFNKHQITSLSIDSPLTQKLLGKNIGDTAELESPKGSQILSILEIK